MEEGIPQRRTKDSSSEDGVSQIDNVGKNVFDGDSPNSRLEIGLQEVEIDIGNSFTIELSQQEIFEHTIESIGYITQISANLVTAANGKNPTGNANETQVSGTALFSEAPLSISVSVCLQERDERIFKHAFDNLRDDRRQVNTPVITSIVNGRFFVNWKNVMNPPPNGSPCFV